MQKIEEIYRSRLKMLVEEVGTQRALADIIHKSPAQISQWLNASPDSRTGKPRSMDRNTAREIERLFPKPDGWMDQALPAAADESGESLATYVPGAAQLEVPLLANSGSMGFGSEQIDEEVVIGRLTVSPEWASRTLKPLTQLQNLRFIHGYGDSMAPTFSDGDILLVDIGVTDPKIDGIYVLEANDRVYIKRVRQRLDGNFEISSDNANVKTVDVLNGTHSVNVRGRVVWAWNGKKM
jgi:phage repressor protein C with HTH and peptisase S24 domain